MKKLITIFMLMVFSCGMILVPALHDIHRSMCLNQGGSCCGNYSESHVYDHDANQTAAGLHQKWNMHNCLECPICQLASLSLCVPEFSVDVPLLNGNADNSFVIFVEQEFTAPRLLPFSCGPPA